MGRQESEFIKKLERSEHNAGIRNLVIFELILAVVWGLVTRAMPDGGLVMAAVNIAGLILSFILAAGLRSFLRYYFSGGVSFIIAVAQWLLIFSVMRGVI